MLPFFLHKNMNGKQLNKLPVYQLQKVPALREICVIGTVRASHSRGSPTNTKIPHLHVHNPKIAVVGSAVVKTV